MLVLTAGLVGCGSGGFTSEHDPSVTVDSLTDEEAADLCVAVFEYYDTLHGEDSTVEVLCRASSLGESDEAACTEAFGSCSVPFDLRALCESRITVTREACPATIAEIEACADATAALYGDVLARTCGEAPIENWAALTASADECASLPGTCNALVLQSSR